MQRTCPHCSSAFTVDPDDLAFLEKISPVFQGKRELIPPPTLCPHCRLQRRMTYRPSIFVFFRPGFPDGKNIFSMYPAQMPFPVMRNEDWMGDGWDPLSYGEDIDPSRTFFDQFHEFSARVPQPALAALQNENCDFCNNLSKNKNCYLVFNISGAEDCMYCENAWDSRDCVECTMTLQSELCYGCTYCLRCYNLQDSNYSEDCTDSFFLSFCRSCKHCFCCVNLRRAEYCVFNEQKTKEEYEDFIAGFRRTSWKERERYRKQLEEMERSAPRPHSIQRQAEDVSGNFLQECRDVHDSFFIQHGESLRRCFNCHEHLKDCHDYSFFGRNAELIYESAACGINIQRLSFCYESREGSTNLFYCWFCDGCHDCFGCISLRKKAYCIFNTQYSKQEYETIVPQLIARMRQHNQWGEFFSMQLSPLPYNCTVAQRYFPHTKDSASKDGLRWQDDEPLFASSSVLASTDLPDDLPADDDSIVVKSSLSGRPFKITQEEIKRYRVLNVPLPRTTYDERMEERAKKLGGITLYERTCAKTGKPILTTYPPDSHWIIWDKDVYEQEFGS